jgi:hypothetical protein
VNKVEFVKILFGNKKEEDGCCGVEIKEIENKEESCCETNSSVKTESCCENEKKSKKTLCCP